MDSFAPIWEQVDNFRKVIREEMRAAPDGIHLLCFSQGECSQEDHVCTARFCLCHFFFDRVWFLSFLPGGLICRAILATTPDHNVHTFISLAAPQAGQYGGQTKHFHLLLTLGVIKHLYSIFLLFSAVSWVEWHSFLIYYNILRVYDFDYYVIMKNKMLHASLCVLFQRLTTSSRYSLSWWRRPFFKPAAITDARCPYVATGRVRESGDCLLRGATPSRFHRLSNRNACLCVSLLRPSPPTQLPRVQQLPGQVGRRETSSRAWRCALDQMNETPVVRLLENDQRERGGK